jgi:hypothetical protein
MCRELRRGFAYAEQSLAELDTITRVPAEAWQTYKLIPPDLEPICRREDNAGRGPREGAAEGQLQKRLDAIVEEHGLRAADLGGNVQPEARAGLNHDDRLRELRVRLDRLEAAKAWHHL